LIVTPTGLRIIDFDDCGEGSYEFEIGNSLYMVLFDSWHTGNPDRYQRFRSWFINGYRSTASIPIDEQLLNRSIEVRTEALGRWLANPAKAPVGIQTASSEWLRSFLGGPADDVRP
jgi:Ser/Thr protein kinase RdoA (MazF antagonist)